MMNLRFIGLILLAFLILVLSEETNNSNLSETDTSNSKTKEKDRPGHPGSPPGFGTHAQSNSNKTLFIFLGAVGGFFLLIGLSYLICFCVGVGYFNKNRRMNRAGMVYGNNSQPVGENTAVGTAGQPSESIPSTMMQQSPPPPYGYNAQAQPNQASNQVKSGWGAELT